MLGDTITGNNSQQTDQIELNNSVPLVAGDSPRKVHSPGLSSLQDGKDDIQTMTTPNKFAALQELEDDNLETQSDQGNIHDNDTLQFSLSDGEVHSPTRTKRVYTRRAAAPTESE